MASSSGTPAAATPESVIDGIGFELPSGANCFQSETADEVWWRMDMNAFWRIWYIDVHLRSHGVRRENPKLS